MTAVLGGMEVAGAEGGARAAAATLVPLIAPNKECRLEENCCT